MAQVDPFARFPEMTRIRSGPRLIHFLGFGLYLYGDRDFDMETQSFVRTLCFCAMYIPLIALRAYRAAPAADGWAYLGRVPVSPSARAWSLVLGLAMMGAGGALGANAVYNAPWRVTARQMEQAEQLIAEGKIGEAARLLARVATGTSDRATPAALRLAELLDHPSLKGDGKTTLTVFRAAADVHKAGRWPSGASPILARGQDAARSLSAKDPKGALLLLEEVERLGPVDPATAEVRHQLLEAVVAADPSDPEWVSRLAVDYESRNQLDRAEKILEPLRSRLGEREGARVLGMIDARANRVEAALPLLRAYTGPRLRRLGEAEAKLQDLYRRGQDRVLELLKNSRQADFDYDRYRRASDSQKQSMVIRYVEDRIKMDPAIAPAQQALIAESGVVPVSLELAILLLQHAQAQADPARRKSLLDEAESTFLSVSRMAGNRAEYQINLAQVYYWQGKHMEGRRLLDKVLADHNRDPALLVQVADLLRDVGSESEGRTVAEEAFNKATVPAVKNQAAVLRALMGDDVDERVLWLQRANPDDPHIKALLHSDLANQALAHGNDKAAIANLKQVVSLYEAMPESTAVLNNLWIALSKLARLTGDRSARERGLAMVQRGAQLSPGDGLALINASQALLEAGLRDEIGGAVDLGVLRSDADFELLDFLVQDERGRADFAARIRSNPRISRALAMREKAILLVPRNPDFYASLVGLLMWRRDGDGLRRLLATLDRADLDLEGHAKQERENESGRRDKQLAERARGAVLLAEPIVPVARAKGGATFAVAATMLTQARIGASLHGMPADPDALVALAEEAASKAPSLSSRLGVFHALLFRAADRLARDDGRFEGLRRRYFRSISDEELIAAVLSEEGDLKRKVLEDPDLNRALGIAREVFGNSPSVLSGPRMWATMRDRYPEVAAGMAKFHLGNDWDNLGDRARVRLTPYDASSVLRNYWTARMQGRESEGLALVEEAKTQDIPVPIHVP